MTRKDLQDIIREEYKNHMMEEGIMSWLVDKAANAAKWYADKDAQYNYEAILASKEFRSLASKFGMEEKEFVSKARTMIQRDPQKFAGLLTYDASKQGYLKYTK